MDDEKSEHVKMEPLDAVISVAHGNVSVLTSNELVVDHVIEAIGMGRYQWQLLFSCSFGFLVDQMLLISITIIMPNAAKEFGPRYQTLLSASLYAGLFVGALTCGILADLLGRKLIWQLSIFGVSSVTLLAASSPNWAALNIWTTLCGFLAGGNLAIDLTVLAESLPQKWAFLLTGIACVWGLGNAVTALISWPLVVQFCCPNGTNPETCARSGNMGWRYIDIVLGGLCLIMSIVRSFILGMHESPKWLVSKGRIDDAVRALNSISSKNKSEFTADPQLFINIPQEQVANPTWLEDVVSMRELFYGWKNIKLMGIMMLLWAFVGICYPLYNVFLPYYLEAHGANLGDGSNYQTYRDLAISSVVGIFGPLLSAYFVSLPKLRHQGALVITGCICALFAGLFTQVRTEGQNIGFSCMINFWLNAVYAIIYGYTPACLTTKHRGVGCGMLMACGRLVSISAPFIATFGDVTSGVPLWVSCALYVAIALLGLALPRIDH